MVVVLLDVGVDLGLVAVVVGQRRMHVGEREGGIGRDDLIGAHPRALIVERNVLDGDAMAVKAWLAAARAGGADDPRPVECPTARWLILPGLVFSGSWFHQFIVPRTPGLVSRRLRRNRESSASCRALPP